MSVSINDESLDVDFGDEEQEEEINIGVSRFLLMLG